MQGATRVALLLTEPTAANDSLLALAEAKASALPDVALVERREIERVLREQKLSLAGFVNANNAVQAGKLLRAEVLAIVEMNAQTTNALGLVVFDARSGARLWDAALPKGIEPAANAIAAGVQQSVAKSNLQPASRRVVSLLTVRNADMPRSMDRFCDAVGELFERKLSQSPIILVLERGRLDQLNRERELTPANGTNSLLASVTLIQMDIGRATEGPGLDGIAILTDHDGRTANRVKTTLKTESASALATELASRVLNTFGAKPATSVTDFELQRREAQRFFREAQARVTHRETEAAWRAVEAAHALDSGDVEIEALLMRCLLDEGTNLLGDGRTKRLLDPRYTGYKARNLSPSKPEKSIVRSFPLEAVVREVMRPKNYEKRSDWDTPKFQQVVRDMTEVVARRLEQVDEVQGIDPSVLRDPQRREALVAHLLQRLTQDSMWGFDRTKPQSDENLYRYIKDTELKELPLTRDELLDALEFGVRSIGFREVRLRKAIHEGDAKRMNEEELRAAASMGAMVGYAERVYHHCRLSTDAQVQEKFGKFREQFLAMDWERFDAWARVATEKPELFPMFTHVIEGWQGLSVRYLAPIPDEFIERLNRYLTRWLEAGNAHPPTVDHANRISQLFERIGWAVDPQMFFPIANVYTNDAIRPEHLGSLKPMADAVVASPSPVISAQGRKLKELLDLRTGKATGDAQEEACRRISIEIARIPDFDTRLHEHVRFFDQMLEQKFIYSPPVRDISELMRKRLLDNKDLSGRIEKIIAATDDAQFKFSKEGTRRDYLKSILVQDNNLLSSYLKDATNLPWSTPVRLLDLTKFPQVDVLTRMAVTRDAVYALGVQQRAVSDPDKQFWGYKMTLSLVRTPLKPGDAEIVGVTDFNLTNAPGILPTLNVQIGGSTFYAMLDGWGVFAFPLNGGPVTRLDEKLDLPDRQMDSFAVVGNKLFLGLRGYIVSCDLATKQVKTLASSRRTDKQCDLDGGPVFRTRFMIPDEKRRRIVLVVERDYRTREFWALEVATGRITHLLTPDELFHAERADRSGEDLVIFSSCYLEAFHLDTGKLERLAIDNFCGGRSDEVYPLGRLMEREWFAGAHLVHNGYLWSAGSFGRISFADKKPQRHPPVSPPDPKTSMHMDPNNVGCLVPTGNGNALVFGSASGVWLLPLR